MSRYELMQYNRCGSSGLKLPVVSLGGWHNYSNPDQARTLTLKAWELGITHLDFANNYGPPPGAAETSFGKIMRHDLAGHRDELIISSKAGYYMWEGPYGDWGSKKYLTASLHQSLKRLQLDYVDIFYSHRFDPDTPLEETMGALAQFIREGKALYAGISNYPAKAAKKAAKIMTKLHAPLIIHQCAYNMLDRHIEDKVLEETAAHGMGMIVFSPLAQGQLTDRYLHGIPADSRAATGGFLKPEQITKQKIEVIAKLNDLAKARGQTLSQLALTWLLRDRRVTSLLIGASKPEQITDCCKVLTAGLLSAEELRTIETILAPVSPSPLTPPARPAVKKVLKPIVKKHRTFP
ncbi:MAG: aldo/keto reductase [Verrucomicrobiales bacterium]|jgi:L-glyceraldehyde 3-phosphate reductase|nr:aldo/keto reductase [Verrucomicrobiales bacterium]